ncbi:DUF1648 domain-containing protein [Algibacter amylolyticus]|uniref:DUF1648 domain-containing protein n=1 Tax=Algibacter amylolyticus TaxID=1608400 RepID=A0A5M7B3B1_9FLAO|nr:DUF1648 domain-containing protein [Algibacter amylolyticus]KAA5823370.1 DUF1648 domain-containing protein [Algibacter amylolyticus]MBB5267516.1 putative membrane protein [Algibacter amylolyticus]TSJ73858.1 DUF1648 domain-containing protein [Algibacter amylolyticus]
MNTRPRIKLKLTKTDKTLEIFGWVSLLVLWSLTLANYVELPEIIPTHYNSTGEVDAFGDKSNIFALPIITTILFVGLTILNKNPHVFNYPCEITKENALHQYTNATRMMRVLKLVVVLIFGIIVFRTIENVNGNADGLGTWFLPLTMAMIFIPMIYFLNNANRNKN